MFEDIYIYFDLNFVNFSPILPYSIGTRIVTLCFHVIQTFNQVT